MIHVNHENDGQAWSAQVWKRIKLSALGVGVLMGAGIGALMILSAGKGEDIAGIVAPALLIALVSGVVATVAALRQKRAQNNR
jgi:hypothetical protein